VPALEEASLSVSIASGFIGQTRDADTGQARAAELRLIEAAQQGDRGAFGALYARYGRLVHGILLTLVPHPDVEDLVQDVFVRAMQRLASLRDPGAFGGWLVTIARNLAIDHLRHVRPVEEMRDEVAAGTDERTEAVAVLAAIRSLPLAYRETLVLRLIEGMTGPEIAARTGLTPASVRVNLHRGMKQLRQRLEGSTRRE
jgi:RNA polymerase sigma-70 factor (ECF subfamily)